MSELNRQDLATAAGAVAAAGPLVIVEPDSPGGR